MIMLLRLIPTLVSLGIAINKSLCGEWDKAWRLRVLRRALKKDPAKAKRLIDAMIEDEENSN